MGDGPAGDALDGAPDAVLVPRAAEGDVRAFRILVIRYTPLMRVYVRRVLGSNSDVDDVVQESLLVAWQQLPRLDDPSVFRSWLLRTTSRKAIDRVRSRRHHDDVDDHPQVAPTAGEPGEVSETRGRHAALAAALRALPADQRRAWVLQELGAYSYQDIATELDLPVSTVRGLLSRARKNLIQEMAGWR